MNEFIGLNGTMATKYPLRFFNKSKIQVYLDLTILFNINIAGDKAGDGRIAAKLFNGATEMNEHSEIGSLLDQVKKYDCSCKVI